MADFLSLLCSGRTIVMDGAMGTELQRLYCSATQLEQDQSRECFEFWNLTHPERIHGVHRAYLDAGAECLVTNTFQANPAALARYGHEPK